MGMSYLEVFEKVRKATAGLKEGAVAEHLAIQVNLTDEDASGICYLEATDGVFHAEPYDYYDRDALFTVKSADLVKILGGKLDYDKAVADGILTVLGNAERAAELKAAIPAPKKRATTGKRTKRAKETPTV